jgi:hypothetical protein
VLVTVPGCDVDRIQLGRRDRPRTHREVALLTGARHFATAAAVASGPSDFLPGGGAYATGATPASVRKRAGVSSSYEAKNVPTTSSSSVMPSAQNSTG